MKLPRPYIPLATRLIVARRQALKCGYDPNGEVMFAILPKAQQLKALLRVLFGDAPVHLDHHPALENRQRIGDRYLPDANDPDYLTYRTAHDHHIKTSVRGDGAQFADNVIAKRERRRRKKLEGKRRKFKWPKRRWSKPCKQSGSRRI